MNGLQKLETAPGPLWLLRLDAVSDAQLAQWESWLAPEKRTRAVRQDVLHRRQTICADGLARLMLAELGGAAPDALRFTLSAYGKPSCPTLPLFFSLSHSGNYAACAVSTRPVGLDLEQIRPLRPALLHIFSDGERAWVGADAARFAQLWTAKESLVKCRGAALGSLRRLPLSMTPDGPSAQQDTQRLYFPPAPAGYALTLCGEL